MTSPTIDEGSMAATLSNSPTAQPLRLDALGLQQREKRLTPWLALLMERGRAVLDTLDRTWSAIWFQHATTTPLEIVRIGLGAAVLFHYATGAPFLLDLWGDNGWLPREFAQAYISGPWMQSVFYYFTAPWQWIAFDALFLFCCAAFTVGWRTSWVKWIVLIGQISFDHRDLTVVYGADSIIACLLFILCLAPIGRGMSLDRLRAVRAAKRQNLAARLPQYTSPWASACIRLIQIQLAVLFFYSAADKLRVDEWWNGDAVWLALTTYEFYHPFALHFFARHFWLINIATYSTLLIELAFPFLIWQRRTRPYLLAGAVMLHFMFGALLRLIYFSFVMIVAHMSFLYPDWLHRLGAWWKRKTGDMEMIYDGRCGFCVRSMAWLLAFDGLGQIGIRDFRTSPSPLVSDAQLEKALYTVLPDGRALAGFEAYRYVVARVPGLWWLVPLFYVPALSRLIGHPIYNWVAANRSRLSAMMISRQWRNGLTYVAMSLFVGWHTFVMVVTPNPSWAARSIRAVIQPYISLFRIESTWAFFAPSVGKHSLFRYVIEDSAGGQHTFVPVRELSRYFPSDYWIRNAYYEIIRYPAIQGPFFAAEFCREQAALRPVSITLQAVQEQPFDPADELRGKNPLDPEFIRVDTLFHASCNNEPDLGRQTRQ